MTTKEVLNKLHDAGVYPDTLSKSNGIFTYRVGFYYTHGQTAGTHVARVKTALPDAVVLDSGEMWKPFRGGASVANQSHWYVKFEVKD